MLACAQLEANAAIALHGAGGDDCWNAKLCPRRRSHYRHRRENNAKRRAEHLTEKGGAEAGPEVVTVSFDLKPVAYLYLYRAQRQDAPLHAISVSVWQGEQRVMEIKPIHCSGLRNRQIQKYLEKVMDELRERHGIQKFESKIRM